MVPWALDQGERWFGTASFDRVGFTAVFLKSDQLYNSERSICKTPIETSTSWTWIFSHSRFSLGAAPNFEKYNIATTYLLHFNFSQRDSKMMDFYQFPFHYYVRYRIFDSSNWKIPNKLMEIIGISSYNDLWIIELSVRSLFLYFHLISITPRLSKKRRNVPSSFDVVAFGHRVSSYVVIKLSQVWIWCAYSPILPKRVLWEYVLLYYYCLLSIATALGELSIERRDKLHYIIPQDRWQFATDYGLMSTPHLGRSRVYSIIIFLDDDP